MSCSVIIKEEVVRMWDCGDLNYGWEISGLTVYVSSMIYRRKMEHDF